MADELSPDFKRFEDLVMVLVSEWQMFEELFIPEANYEIFNRTGSTFWMNLRSILLNGLFLSVSRFFDPEEMSNRKNLSLRYIVTLPELESIKPEIEKRGREMWPIYQRGIDKWRNRRIGHNDLATSLLTEKLPDVPFEEVEQLVKGLWAIVAFTYHELRGMQIGDRVHTLGGVPLVMSYLKKGIEMEKKEREALRSSLGLQPVEPSPDLG